MEDQSIHEDQALVKKRAMQRMIVAAVLVAAAIVALTFLNHKKAEIPVTSSAGTGLEGQTVIPPIQSPIQAPETPQAEPSEAEADAPPLPTEASSTQPPPPPPEVVNKPTDASAAHVVPSPGARRAPLAARSDIREADAPETMPQAIKIMPTEPAPVKSAPLKPPPAKTAPEQLKTAAPAAPAAPVAKPAPEPQAYTVQVGLFSNYENAIQLQKRLAENGIKSYTETRLHVGPFKNKAEAEAAQAKLRELGLSPVVAPAR